MVGSPCLLPSELFMVPALYIRRGTIFFFLEGKSFFKTRGVALAACFLYSSVFGSSGIFFVFTTLCLFRHVCIYMERREICRAASIGHSPVGAFSV